MIEYTGSSKIDHGPLKPRAGYPTAINSNIYYTNQGWLATQIEFQQWKKTDAYTVWRKRQWAKQDGCCYYCEKSLRGQQVNIDHIRPKSQGGTNYASNLVLTCAECNKKKSNRMLPKTKRVQRNNAIRPKPRPERSAAINNAIRIHKELDAQLNYRLQSED